VAEWREIATHEQAVLEGKCADAGAGLPPDVDPSDSLAHWTQRYGGERRCRALGHLPFLGMIVSAKPIANVDAESGFSRPKQISDPHRQRIESEALQYQFVASKTGEVADPALHILLRRYVEARRTRASSVFAPSRMEHGLHPAEYFVWETRKEFLRPIGRIHVTPDHDPVEGDVLMT
jgi:hypothetical protein